MDQFALKDVKIGTETINSRPIEWNEKDEPTKYVTTCPGCGGLIEFSAEYNGVKCPSCKIGEDRRILAELEDPFHTQEDLEALAFPADEE